MSTNIIAPSNLSSLPAPQQDSRATLQGINSLLLSSLLANRKSIRNKLMKIQHFDFTAVMSRVAKENPSWSTDRLATALSEYQKWMAICASVSAGVVCGMCSEDVDSVWHAHILYTKHYAHFCGEVAGHFIHHEPTSDEDKAEKDKSSVINTLTMLKFCFGKLNPVWRRAASGCEEDDASPSYCDSCANCNTCQGAHYL